MHYNVQMCACARSTKKDGRKIAFHGYGSYFVLIAILYKVLEYTYSLAKLDSAAGEIRLTLTIVKERSRSTSIVHDATESLRVKIFCHVD